MSFNSSATSNEQRLDGASTLIQQRLMGIDYLFT
jgi:hypothetical protein